MVKNACGSLRPGAYSARMDAQTFAELADRVIAETRHMRARTQESRAQAQLVSRDAQATCSAAAETGRRVSEVVAAIRRSRRFTQ